MSVFVREIIVLSIRRRELPSSKKIPKLFGSQLPRKPIGTNGKWPLIALVAPLAPPWRRPRIAAMKGCTPKTAPRVVEPFVVPWILVEEDPLRPMIVPPVPNVSGRLHLSNTPIFAVSVRLDSLEMDTSASQMIPRPNPRSCLMVARPRKKPSSRIIIVIVPNPSLMRVRGFPPVPVRHCYFALHTRARKELHTLLCRAVGGDCVSVG